MTAGIGRIGRHEGSVAHGKDVVLPFDAIESVGLHPTSPSEPIGSVETRKGPC